MNKPKGPTSHDLVIKLRWYLGTKAVGHAGTLDPMAEGLMILLIGDATKLSQWIIETSKAYSGTITLGAETTTDDAEGKKTYLFSKVKVFEKEVLDVFDSLKGKQELTVPKYSAIKQEGRKLYEFARSGKNIVCPKRVMNFYDLKLLKISGSNISFSLNCSKGTYIRSWAVEVGRRLGTGAFLSSLKRTRIGDFYLKKAQDIKFFKNLKNLSTNDIFAKVKASGCFISLSESLPKAKIIKLNSKEEILFSNGQIPNSVRTRISSLLKDALRNKKTYLIRMFGSGGRLAGIVDIDYEGHLKIQRVFNDPIKQTF